MSAVASLTAPAAVTAGKAAAFSRGASRVAQVRAPRLPPARSLGVRDRSVVGPRRPRNPLPSRQVPRPLTPTPPTHRPSAPAQVRGLPRLGAKSARLSTVRTYAAREVGMKKDGTSATVRRPRTTVPAAVSSVARSIDRRAARSPARASATRTARADPRRARRARRAPAAAPPPSRRAPSLAASVLTPTRPPSPHLPPPPTSPRRQGRKPNPKFAQEDGKLWVCQGCGYIYDGSLGQWGETKRCPACGERRFALKTQAEMNIAIGSIGVVALLVAALYLLVKLA